jgi:hypothetical protein
VLELIKNLFLSIFLLLNDECYLLFINKLNIQLTSKIEMERENEINKKIKEYKVNLLLYYLFIRLVSVKSLEIIEINKLIII